MKRKHVIVTLLAMFILTICVADAYAYAYSDSYVSHFKMKKCVNVNTIDPRFPGTFYIDEGQTEVVTRMSKQTKPDQATSKYFYVDIYEDNIVLDVKVGSIRLNREGQSSGICNHLKKGKYYFRLKKSNDGCTISGSIEIKY